MRPTGGHTWSGQPRAPLSTCAVYRFHFVSRSHIRATGGRNVFIGKKWHCPLKADKPLIFWLPFFVVSPDEMSCGVMWRSDLGPAVQPKHYQRKHMATLRPVDTGSQWTHCCIVGGKRTVPFPLLRLSYWTGKKRPHSHYTQSFAEDGEKNVRERKKKTVRGAHPCM